MISLRPYQLKTKALVKQAWAEGYKRVILCKPTGAGKTVTFADIARESVLNGYPTMVVCNRQELIGQAKDKLNKLGLFPTLIVPGYRDKVSNLYLASVDTLRNRKFPDIKLLIIDEAHIRDFDPVVLHYIRCGCYIIGATATPVRSGKAEIEEYPDYKGQLCDMYEQIIETITITELIEQDYLVPAITYGAALDLSDIATSATVDGPEYNKKQMFQKFNKPKLYAGVIDNYLKFAANTKALIFNINVEHSKKMTEEFNLRGIPSAHIDGKTPDKIRIQIFQDFQAGKIMVLNNCAIATTGYDEPTIETIIINRATMSLSLFLQMCGRGARICKEINKTHFNIIDHGGNVFKHGFWQDERTFDLIPKKINKKLGVKPIKNCEACDALIPANAMSCPYCNIAIAKKEEANQLANAEFVILDKENVPDFLRKPLAKMTVEEIEKYREIKGYQIGWVSRQLITRGREALEQYAKIKNYSASWVTRQLSLIEESRQGAKNDIWDFIKKNKHVEKDFIKEYSIKKLKANHSEQEINIIVPKILEAVDNLRKDLVA